MLVVCIYLDVIYVISKTLCTYHPSSYATRNTRENVQGISNICTSLALFFFIFFRIGLILRTKKDTLIRRSKKRYSVFNQYHGHDGNVVNNLIFMTPADGPLPPVTVSDLPESEFCR